MIRILIVLLCLCSLSSCSNNKKYNTFIGSNIANINLKEMDNTFCFSKIDSSYLDKISSENAYSSNKKMSFDSLIKKTGKLYISIGLFDLLKGIYLDSNQLKYKFSSALLEVYEIHLVNVVNEVYSINPNLEVYLFSLYSPYPNSYGEFVDDLLIGVNLFNLSIQDIAKENSCGYIDISYLSNHMQDFNKVNESVVEKLLENIYG